MKDIDFQMLKLLYETKNISRTAQQLFMTQPALTKRLRRLEEELGTTLVIRNNKGIEFTSQGEYAAGRFTILNDFLEETKNHLREISSIKKEEIILGVPGSYARAQFPELMKRYHEELDHLDFHITTALSDVMFRQFCNGEIDIVIVCGDFPYYGGKVRILEEDLNVITDKVVPIEELENLPVIEYPRHPLAQKPIEDWWKRQFGTRLPVRFKVSNIEVALEMVSNGLGCSFLFGESRRKNHPNTVRTALLNQEGIPIRRNVWMMFTEESLQKKYIREFIAFVREHFQV